MPNTTIFYPSLDGYCANVESSSNWTTVRNDTTCNTVAYATTDVAVCGANYGNSKYSITRGFFLFDTSIISSRATIASAFFSLKVASTADNTQSPNVYVVATTPASTSSLTNNDYDNVGSTSFGYVALASYTAGSRVNTTLNASGLAAITKGGITKFGLRMGNDFNNTPTPTGNNLVTHAYMSEATGTSNDPYLSVTYYVPTVKAIII